MSCWNNILLVYSFYHQPQGRTRRIPRGTPKRGVRACLWRHNPGGVLLALTSDTAPPSCSSGRPPAPDGWRLPGGALGTWAGHSRRSRAPPLRYIARPSFSSDFHCSLLLEVVLFVRCLFFSTQFLILPASPLCLKVFDMARFPGPAEGVPQTHQGGAYTARVSFETRVLWRARGTDLPGELNKRRAFTSKARSSFSSWANQGWRPSSSSLSLNIFPWIGPHIILVYLSIFDFESMTKLTVSAMNAFILSTEVQVLIFALIAFFFPDLFENKLQTLWHVTAN